MAGEKQDFLRRWSRRKQAQLRRDAGPGPAAPAAVVPPPLPPVESLSFESDFKAFMHAKVEEGVKRAALKKLFADPRFNIMDGLDVYIDDYSKGEILPDEMLAKLEHARSTLFGPQPERAAETQSTGGPGVAEQVGAASAATEGNGESQAERPRTDHGAQG